MPTKHIKAENALIGVGAQILQQLDYAQTIAVLFSNIQQERQKMGMTVIHFDWFLLSLDFLYTITAIKYEDGLVGKFNQ